MSNKLGLAIKLFLVNHSLSQKWLSDKVGVSYTFTSGLIRGDKALPVSMAHKIGAEFDKLHKIDEPWSVFLVRAYIEDLSAKKLAELAEYSKQQEQNK